MAQCVGNHDFAIYAYIWPPWHTMPPPSKFWKIIFYLLFNLFWDDLNHQIRWHSILGVWHRIFKFHYTAYLTSTKVIYTVYIRSPAFSIIIYFDGRLCSFQAGICSDQTSLQTGVDIFCIISKKSYIFKQKPLSSLDI